MLNYSLSQKMRGFKMTSKKWWAIFITLSSIEAVLLLKLVRTESLTELLIAISLIAALLIFTTRIETKD
ncbi:hypothetical protein C7H19_18235 [Aphanothece hegewaldii CCALA 016]|uniref:Uncharacterized protein n=2 Tax=Aphanothece TaxID=1121 RepID=A0A2T1LU19_9CHRO|nr:hypothetical protein C7H19_18235 [Aphanothece hegewaldii CCALA 016]